MILEQLLGASADDLEKLTQSELDEICKPYWNITRPEYAPKQKTSSNTKRSLTEPLIQDTEKQRKIARGLEMARQFGLEI